MRDSLGGQQAPISRSGSARSFNTSYGRPPASPSPRPPRAQVMHLCTVGSDLFHPIRKSYFYNIFENNDEIFCLFKAGCICLFSYRSRINAGRINKRIFC